MSKLWLEASGGGKGQARMGSAGKGQTRPSSQAVAGGLGRWEGTGSDGKSWQGADGTVISGFLPSRP